MRTTRDLQNKTITVTGGKGFLGQHLIRALESRGCRDISVADLPEHGISRFVHIQST